MHNSYYMANGLEAIDVIDAYKLDFSLGNVVKYVLRAGRKTDDCLEDLRKAKDYLEHAITVRSNNEMLKKLQEREQM